MKTSIHFKHLFLFLFGLWLSSNGIASEAASLSLKASKANTTNPTTLPIPNLYCGTPTGLSTSNITESSVTLQWSMVSGAMSYSVQLRVPYGQWSYAPGSPFMNTMVMINGLSMGTTYEWRVRANCTYGETSYWTQGPNFTTLGSSSCDPPSYLDTYNIGTTTATWDWSPVSGALSYSVQWRYAGGTWNNLNGGPWTNTLLNIAGLQHNTEYEWRVRSNCSNGSTSDWSLRDSFTTLGSSCSTPTGLNVTNITETSATFNWSPVSGAESYSVQIRLPYGQWSFITGSPFMNTYAAVYNLIPGTTYEFRVRANCGYGNQSFWSSGMSFTTLGTVSCEAPGELSTYDITQTTATWDWSPVSGAISYSVQWRFAGGTWHTLSGGPWTGTLLHIGGLSPCTSYEWRVRSNCPNYMTSDWSYGSSFTSLCTNNCDTPTGLFTTNVTETSATFNWDPAAGAVSYSVQIRLPYGSWYFISGSPFMNTSATVYNLAPGTTYEWRVRTNCSYSVHSFWSMPMAFTTPGNASCEAPSELNTYNITQTTATWDWSPVPGAVSYSVQWRYPGGTWHNLCCGPWTGTLLHIGGLQPNTAYEWRVRSNCGNGLTSDWSIPDVFTTLGSSCGTPYNLSTTNITETTATFNWDTVSGAVSYSVQIRLAYGQWYFVAGSPFTNTYATVSGLVPGTVYEWRVRTNCANGVYSYWSQGMTFTTSGSNNIENDNCSNATLLTVGSTCVSVSSSNVNATPSMPAPAGGCPYAGYRDVWFRFLMPNVMNPSVTIRTTAGSLNDAVMEVYVGDDCSNLSFLTCEDDNTNGNGSMMPVINLIGYPNAMIWVRVWGYNGSMGTFDICVFDYLSNNYIDNGNKVSFIAGEQTGQLVTVTEEGPKTKDDLSPLHHVAPNPATDVLFVTYLQTEKSIVTGLVLTDISGKIVLRRDYESHDINKFEEELDVSRLTPGMYVLQIVTTSGIIAEKISVVD